MSLPEVQMPVQITLAAAALDGVSYQPLELVDRRCDLVGFRALESVLGVPRYSD